MSHQFVDDAAKPALEDAEFALLAAIERDAFGVLAQAHQAEAEIGLEALLVEHQPTSGWPIFWVSQVPTTA